MDSITDPKVVNIRGWTTIPFNVKLVDRSTVYGNPFRIGKDGSRLQCIEKFRAWIDKRPYLKEKAKRELKGFDVG